MSGTEVLQVRPSGTDALALRVDTSQRVTFQGKIAAKLPGSSTYAYSSEFKIVMCQKVLFNTAVISSRTWRVVADASSASFESVGSFISSAYTENRPECPITLELINPSTNNPYTSSELVAIGFDANARTLSVHRGKVQILDFYVRATGYAMGTVQSQTVRYSVVCDAPVIKSAFVGVTRVFNMGLKVENTPTYIGFTNDWFDFPSDTSVCRVHAFLHEGDLSAAYLSRPEGTRNLKIYANGQLGVKPGKIFNETVKLRACAKSDRSTIPTSQYDWPCDVPGVKSDAYLGYKVGVACDSDSFSDIDNNIGVGSNSDLRQQMILPVAGETSPPNFTFNITKMEPVNLALCPVTRISIVNTDTPTVSNPQTLMTRFSPNSWSFTVSNPYKNPLNQPVGQPKLESVIANPAYGLTLQFYIKVEFGNGKVRYLKRSESNTQFQIKFSDCDRATVQGPDTASVNFAAVRAPYEDTQWEWYNFKPIAELQSVITVDPSYCNVQRIHLLDKDMNDASAVMRIQRRQIDNQDWLQFYRVAPQQFTRYWLKFNVALDNFENAPSSKTALVPILFKVCGLETLTVKNASRIPQFMWMINQTHNASVPFLDIFEFFTIANHESTCRMKTIDILT